MNEMQFLAWNRYIQIITPYYKKSSGEIDLYNNLLIIIKYNYES